MAASISEITIIFDSNIDSVSCYDSRNNYVIWSASNQANSVSGDYIDIEFTVECKQGYELNTAESFAYVVKDISNNTFTLSVEGGGYYDTITLTSKEATTQKSIDLTTLSGWESLSDGEHFISVIAKADGYADSDPSEEVVVTKEATTTLISFTIAVTTYQAEEGMTWAEWVESEYNTGGFYVNGTKITDGAGYVSTALNTSSHVSSTDVIIENTVYKVYFVPDIT